MELRITPIRNGTVIDHLPAGSALAVCRVLGIPRDGSASTVSVVMNVPSARTGRKDIVKVEDRELAAADLARLAVLAPQATVNLIRDHRVAAKLQVELPERVTDAIRCPNDACISNDDEPVAAEFEVGPVGQTGRPLLTCAFCRSQVTDPLPLVR